MLITCSECGNLISDRAQTCPHCGYPVSTQLLHCVRCDELIHPQTPGCRRCGLPTYETVDMYRKYPEPKYTKEMRGYWASIDLIGKGYEWKLFK